MQSINIIVIAAVTSFCLPVMLILLSAYTLYNTISMAGYARRRNQDLYKTVTMGRAQTKSLKSASPRPSPRTDIGRLNSKKSRPSPGGPTHAEGLKSTSPLILAKPAATVPKSKYRATHSPMSLQMPRQDRNVSTPNPSHFQEFGPKSPGLKVIKSQLTR